MIDPQEMEADLGFLDGVAAFHRRMDVNVGDAASEELGSPRGALPKAILEGRIRALGVTTLFDTWQLIWRLEQERNAVGMGTPLLGLMQSDLRRRAAAREAQGRPGYSSTHRSS